MSDEKVNAISIEGEEEPYAKISQEVGEFDPNKQFINKWNASIKNRMEDAVSTPIDETELRNVKIEDGLENREWERQFVDPYVYGVYASAAEIGVLAEQFANDEGGKGVDKSIRGTVKLFAEIFGLKGGLEIEPISPSENNPALGVYMPGTNTLQFNFDKAAKLHGGVADRMASEVISTVAHEAWHAHQDEIASGNPTLRKSAYGENFKNYTNAGDTYHGYRNQLIEDEAHTIGNAVSEVLERIFSRNKEAFLGNTEACAAMKDWAIKQIKAKEQALEQRGL